MSHDNIERPDVLELTTVIRNFSHVMWQGIIFFS